MRISIWQLLIFYFEIISTVLIIIIILCFTLKVTDNLNTLDDDLAEFSAAVKPYLVMVTNVFMGISGLILVIVLFNVFGVILGATNMPPRSAETRGGSGQCGSHCVMA